MKSHRRIIRRLRALALGLAACAALAAPVGALAQPAHDPATAAPQATIGDTPADYPGVSRAPKHDDNTAATPAPVVGDTPADYPGVGGAPKYDRPTAVEVVRPERTIVRDVNEVLPITLAALALLVALAGAAYVLVRTRPSSPARVGGSH